STTRVRLEVNGAIVVSFQHQSFIHSKQQHSPVIPSAPRFAVSNDGGNGSVVGAKNMESIEVPKPQHENAALQSPCGNSHSAIIFSGPLLRQLENHLRFPASYIGVRRIRPSGGAKVERCNKSSGGSVQNSEIDTWVLNDVEVDTSEHVSDGWDISGTDIAAEDHPIEAEKVSVNEGNGRSQSPCSSSLHCSDASERNRRYDIVYKVIDSSGVERRMTKQEKKHVKNEMRLARQRAHKEERQKKHQERIRISKEEGRKRRKLKRAAWKQRKEQQEPKEERPEEAGESCSEKDVFSRSGANDEVEKNAPLSKKIPTNDCSIQLRFPLYNEARVDEEVAALRGEKRGIPPVLLTPAATSVAIKSGYLKITSNEIDSTSDTGKSAIMDLQLSREWALQLKARMIPVEESRAKENMRPMAYEVVPEVWKRLCPRMLWHPPVDGNYNDLKKTKEHQTMDKMTDESKFRFNDIDASSSPTQQKEVQYSFVPIRNPTSCYDLDARIIFQHLYRQTDLHISCGAIFGCDFLLYDGRREDRHSFAGIRVYSGKRKDIREEGGSINFPIPTAFDIMGYVRAMNTARKLALVATVIYPENQVLSGFAWQNSPRIAIVDLVLEKVLEVETHLKKGNTVKRRSEEEAARALDKKKLKATI
ncbi:hypothetical protein ACHAXS_005604, partial [Conticribra weissflogii]